MGLSRDTGKKVQDGLESLTPIAVQSIELVKESHLPGVKESA